MQIEKSDIAYGDGFFHFATQARCFSGHRKERVKWRIFTTKFPIDYNSRTIISAYIIEVYEFIIEFFLHRGEWI
jgi:hypothetical protein